MPYKCLHVQRSWPQGSPQHNKLNRNSKISFIRSPTSTIFFCSPERMFHWHLTTSCPKLCSFLQCLTACRQRAERSKHRSHESGALQGQGCAARHAEELFPFKLESSFIHFLPPPPFEKRRLVNLKCSRSMVFQTASNHQTDVRDEIWNACSQGSHERVRPLW